MHNQIQGVEITLPMRGYRYSKWEQTCKVIYFGYLLPRECDLLLISKSNYYIFHFLIAFHLLEIGNKNEKKSVTVLGPKNLWVSG